MITKLKFYTNSCKFNLALKATKFILVGFFAVLIDYSTYIILNKLIYSIPVSKASSFIVATSFSFLANKRITFKSHFSIVILLKYLLLYSVTMIFNILVNDFFLAFFNNFKFQTQISFILATGGSATINFIGLNFFVFRNKHLK